jgi:hypothetical protein
VSDHTLASRRMLKSGCWDNITRAVQQVPAGKLRTMSPLSASSVSLVVSVASVVQMWCCNCFCQCMVYVTIQMLASMHMLRFHHLRLSS